MKFLVSTHSGLFVTDENGMCEQISAGFYYGIAIYPDHFITARRVLPFSKTSPTAFEGYHYDGRRTFGPSLDGQSIIDCHQITAAPEGHGLFVANTGKNLLMYLDENEKRSWNLDLSTTRPFERKLNSVFVREKDVFFAFHNGPDRDSEIDWLRIEGEQRVLCDIFRVPHTGIHNVYEEDGWFYYNASEDGMVIKVNRETREADWCKLGKEWHTKGIARVPDGFVTGASQNGTLIERFSSQSRLLFLDINLKKQGEAALLCDGRTIGNVNSVRRIPDASA